MYADIIFLEGRDIPENWEISLPVATEGGKLQLQQLEVARILSMVI